jgi:hypothetical protein
MNAAIRTNPNAEQMIVGRNDSLSTFRFCSAIVTPSFPRVYNKKGIVVSRNFSGGGCPKFVAGIRA